MQIRGRDQRSDGPSNFHPAIPAGDLTWDGLAVERGWKVDPAVCPACQRGMSIPEYKQHRRHGGL